MRKSNLWASVLSLSGLLVCRAQAQVERVWLTHRSNDPSRLVVSWTTKQPGEAPLLKAGTALRKATGSMTVELKSLTGEVLDEQEFRADDREKRLSVSAAKKDGAGFLVHEVQSSYQAGNTQIRVLLPEKVEKGRRYPVVYVLPVEAGRADHYGDGLLEVKKHGLHNRHQAIFVAPTFAHLPWYADHPTRGDIRQEAYLLKVVVPFIEKTYPAQTQAHGRMLLGFSKSGWGAFSLLLRHPAIFARAAAWDAPLMMEGPGRYGSGAIFDTRDNFEKYRVARLLQRRADQLGQEERLILLGHGNFRDDHQQAHALMDRLKVRHAYRDGPARKHDWHSGWVAEATELLLRTPPGAKAP